MNRYVALFVVAMTVSAFAQQPAPAPPRPAKVPAAPAPQAPGAPPAKPAPAKPPAPPAPPARYVEEGGQPINIRLDVSVVDRTAQGTAEPKSLMVMLVDRAVGRTRAAFQDRSIAVDAHPVIVDGRVRVNLTIQSEQFRQNMAEPHDPTLSWRNSFSLLLDNSKPMIALETTDAVTKRKMSIEVKATIQK